MAGCDVVREREGDRVTLRVSGEFDRAAAWSLRELLQDELHSQHTASAVAVDFSLVREFSDLAVAVLARALADLKRPLALRGLRQHQLRIFRYCGIELDERTACAPASFTVPPRRLHP